jgi:hypothetical protein
MNTWRALLAFGALAVAVGIWLSGATTTSASQPAFHEVVDVTGDLFVCDEAEYTVVSGEIRIVIHFGETANGNMNFTGTVTPMNVIVTDGTDTFKVKGAEWFGGTFNANTGGEQFTDTDKFQIVGSGDSVNVVSHFSPNGNEFEFDFGSCASPAD